VNIKELPGPESEEMGSRAAARPIQADLLYRIGLLLDARYPAAPPDSRAHELLEMAVAMYERQALGANPSAPALLRLGIIYSKRGYLKQGQAHLIQSLQSSHDHAELCLLLSYIYDATASPRQQSPADLAHLRQMDSWLTAYVLPDYYWRVGADEQAALAEADWQQRQTHLGVAAALIGLVYTLLTLTGLAIILWALVITKPALRPAALPLRVPWQVLDVAEAVLLLVFLILVVAGAGGALLSAVPTIGESEVATALVRAGTYLLYLGIPILVALWRTRSRGRQAWRLLGFRARRPLTAIATGLAGYAVLIGGAGLALLALKLLGVSPEAPPNSQPTPTEMISSTSSPAALAIYFALIVIVAPILEEILFRGFIYPGLRRTLAPFAAVVLTAALFATIHAIQPSSAPEQVMAIAAIGVLLAILYERSRSLLPCIAAHSLNNCLVFCLVAAQAVF